MADSSEPVKDGSRCEGAEVRNIWDLDVKLLVIHTKVQVVIQVGPIPNDKNNKTQLLKRQSKSGKWR